MLGFNYAQEREIRQRNAHKIQETLDRLNAKQYNQSDAERIHFDQKTPKVVLMRQ